MVECLWIFANLLLEKEIVLAVVEPKHKFLEHFKILLCSENKLLREQVYWVIGNITGENNEICFLVIRQCELLDHFCNLIL